MKNNPVEIVMGAVILLAGCGALYTAYASSQVKPTATGYKVTLRFNKVGGLQEGNAVRIGGLQVGTIATQKLDPETYDAVIVLNMRPDVRLPVDTQAEVSSDGLLGGKFIQLTPGKSKDMIPPDGKVENTKGVVALEEMVGQAVFGGAK